MVEFYNVFIVKIKNAVKRARIVKALYDHRAVLYRYGVGFRNRKARHGAAFNIRIVLLCPYINTSEIIGVNSLFVFYASRILKGAIKQDLC